MCDNEVSKRVFLQSAVSLYIREGGYSEGLCAQSHPLSAGIIRYNNGEADFGPGRLIYTAHGRVLCS